MTIDIADDQKFYQITDDYIGSSSRKSHGIIIANGDALVSSSDDTFGVAVGDKRGFANVRAQPHLLYNRKNGRMPRDLEPFGDYWLVSERTKDCFESIDAEAFDFLECVFTLPDSSPGPKLFVADVVRYLDVVDFQNSEVKLKTYPSGKQRYTFFRGSGILDVRRERVGDRHIFRQRDLVGPPLCDHPFRLAVKSAGLTNVRMAPVWKLDKWMQ